MIPLNLKTVLLKPKKKYAIFICILLFIPLLLDNFLIPGRYSGVKIVLSNIVFGVSLLWGMTNAAGIYLSENYTVNRKLFWMAISLVPLLFFWVSMFYVLIF